MDKYKGIAADALNAMVSQRGVTSHPVPSSVQQAMIEKQMYIYSVAPWPYERPMGTMGMWYIPARLEGQRYSRPCIVPGVIPEDVYVGAMGDGTYQKYYHEGVSLAMDIVGVGMHQSPDNALTKCGVFISDGPEPSEEELLRAEGNLKKHYEEDLAEGDAEYSQNNGIRVITDRSGAQKTVNALKSQHYRAAKALGVKRPWISEGTDTPIPEMLICPECGTGNRPNAIRCKDSECRFVFDEERARQRFPEMFASEKRGPGRPAGSQN